MGLLIVPASIAIAIAACSVALALPLRGPLQRLVAAMLLAQAAITLTLLVTGVGLRHLDGPTIALTAILVAVFAAGIAIARVGRNELANRASTTLRQTGDAVRSLRKDPLLVLLLLVGMAALAWRLVLALRLPVLDYDGLAYHLLTVDVWLQSGAIGRVPQQIWSDGYPANGELLTTWLMAFSRDDWLARLTGLLPLIMATPAVIGVARNLGAARRWAVGAGLVYLLTPAVIILADTTYVDNVVGADLAAAWFFGLASLRSSDAPHRRAPLVLAGIATGLGVGAKASLIPPLAGFALVVVAARALAVANRSARARAVLADAVWLGVPAALVGAYWYVKDLVVFGDPLWPYDLGPFRGVGSVASLFRTPADIQGFGVVSWILRSWISDLGQQYYVYAARMGGYGVGWLLALLLAIAGAVVLVRRGRWAPIIGLAVPSAVTPLLLPIASGGARYTPFVLIAGLALAAVALTQFRPRPAAVISVALTIATLFSLFIATRVANQIVLPATPHTSLRQLVRLVVADGPTRSALGLWAECAGMSAIPSGASVGTDGFDLPHLVVGHTLDRHLTLNVAPSDDPTTLRAEAASVGASYLVLGALSSQAAARADPAAFRVIGPVCLGVDLVAVLPPP